MTLREKSCGKLIRMNEDITFDNLSPPHRMVAWAVTERICHWHWHLFLRKKLENSNKDITVSSCHAFISNDILIRLFLLIGALYCQSLPNITYLPCLWKSVSTSAMRKVWGKCKHPFHTVWLNIAMPQLYIYANSISSSSVNYIFIFCS